MKKTAFRLRARDWVGSAACFAAVLASLVILDPRVGHRLSGLIASTPGGEFRVATDQAHALGMALLGALKDQSIDHAPLLVFTAVAILLVGFMVRT